MSEEQNLQNETQEIYGEEFIKMIAKRARFTQEDVHVILNTIIELFGEAILEGKTINIRGLGKLYITDWPEREGWDALTNQPKKYPATKKVLFKVAQNLRDLAKPK